MNEHSWPGEDRLGATEQEELDPEASAEPEPVEAEAAPQHEQIAADGAEPAVGEDTPAPDEAPAE